MFVYSCVSTNYPDIDIITGYHSILLPHYPLWHVAMGLQTKQQSITITGKNRKYLPEVSQEVNQQHLGLHPHQVLAKAGPGINLAGKVCLL